MPIFQPPSVDRTTSWLPAGAIQSTVPEDRCATHANGALLSTGRLSLFGGLVLPARTTINYISFVSGTTAGGTLTAQWFCLVDPGSLAVLATTVDDTSTAWAANSVKRLTITGGYTTGALAAPVYVGINVTATTVPSLIQLTVSSTVTGIPPMVAATSSTGLTTPASLGATAGALTALGGLAYAYVS